MSTSHVCFVEQFIFWFKRIVQQQQLIQFNIFLFSVLVLFFYNVPWKVSTAMVCEAPFTPRAPWEDQISIRCCGQDWAVNTVVTATLFIWTNGNRTKNSWRLKCHTWDINCKMCRLSLLYFSKMEGNVWIRKDIRTGKDPASVWTKTCRLTLMLWVSAAFMTVQWQQWKLPSN